MTDRLLLALRDCWSHPWLRRTVLVVSVLCASLAVLREFRLPVPPEPLNQYESDRLLYYIQPHAAECVGASYSTRHAMGAGVYAYGLKDPKQTAPAPFSDGLGIGTWHFDIRTDASALMKGGGTFRHKYVNFVKTLYKESGSSKGRRLKRHQNTSFVSLICGDNWLELYRRSIVKTRDQINRVSHAIPIAHKFQRSSRQQSRIPHSHAKDNGFPPPGQQTSGREVRMPRG